MSTHIGIGFSNHPDPVKAATNAVQKAKQQLGEEAPNFGFLWATPYYQPQEFLPVLSENLSPIELLGCSTTHLFDHDHVESIGILLVLFSSPQIKFETSHTTHLPLQEPQEAGKRLVKNFAFGFSQKYRKAMIFFVDGATENIDLLAQGISSSLRTSIPIIGIGSSLPSQPSPSYQYYQDTFLTQSVCGVIFDENVQVNIGLQHGWRPLGKPRRITSATQNIIHTIDDQKAVDLYQGFFPDLSLAQNPEKIQQIKLRYPLGIRPPGSETYIVRNISGILDDGSIVCQDKINTGDTVHLLLGNKRTCLQATEQAAYQARELLAGQRPKLILAISSHVRYNMMGRTTKKELQIIRNILGEDVPLVGFCSQKELVLLAEGNATPPVVQNNSILILTIS